MQVFPSVSSYNPLKQSGIHLVPSRKKAPVHLEHPLSVPVEQAKQLVWQALHFLSVASPHNPSVQLFKHLFSNKKRGVAQESH